MIFKSELFKEFDAQTTNPGAQTAEKIISGY